MALGALRLVYAVLWIPVLTEDVIECVLVLCCRVDICVAGASVLDTFSFIANKLKLILDFLGIAE